MMSTCFALRAQVVVDMFLSGGYTIPTIRDERAPASYYDKSYYLAHGIDFLIDESRTFIPYAGLRISKHQFRSVEQFSNGKELSSNNECIALSAVGGMQYAHPLGDRTSLRVAFGAGPFFDGGNSQRGSAFNAVAEASVGLKWRFVTLGVKLVKPFGAFGQSTYGLDGESSNNYDVSIAALELRLTPPPLPPRGEFGPRGPVRRGPSGYESARQRNARVELGLAVGPAFVDVTDRGYYDSNPAGSGAVGMLTFDVYGDGNKRPVCFAAGARVGVSPFGINVIHVGGFQINTSPTKDIGIRLSAMGGPLIYTGENFMKFNLVLEGNAGVLINHRWSVGLKYMQPIEDLNDFYYRQPEYGSTYRVRYLMGEIKVRFGRR